MAVGLNVWAFVSHTNIPWKACEVEEAVLNKQVTRMARPMPSVLSRFNPHKRAQEGMDLSWWSEVATTMTE